MAVSDGDKAECKEIAREIVQEVLVQHIQACPHGLLLTKFKWLVLGMTVGPLLGGGIGGYAIAKLLVTGGP
jgi:hypothetical protein